MSEPVLLESDITILFLLCIFLEVKDPLYLQKWQMEMPSISYAQYFQCCQIKLQTEKSHLCSGSLGIAKGQTGHRRF